MIGFQILICTHILIILICSENLASARPFFCSRLTIKTFGRAQQVPYCCSGGEMRIPLVSGQLFLELLTETLVRTWHAQATQELSC